MKRKKPSEIGYHVNLIKNRMEIKMLDQVSIISFMFVMGFSLMVLATGEIGYLIAVILFSIMSALFWYNSIIIERKTRLYIRRGYK